VEIARIAECHVNIGVDTACTAIASANGNENTIAIAAVNQMMAVWFARRPRRDVACPQKRFGIILNQHGFARKDDDDFVFLMVPVPVR